MLRHSLSSLAILSLVVVGCSSDPAPAPAPAEEAGTDAVVDSGADTKKPVEETGPEPIACQEPVDDVVCTAPVKAVGGTACTDAMLTELAEKCLAADVTVPAACDEWKTAYAACASCVKTWSYAEEIGGPPGNIYPDDWLCYWAVMDATCATHVNCMFECEYTACGNCMDPEERSRCFDTASKPGGVCYDLASKEGNACFTKHETALEGCNVDEIYKTTADLPTLKQQVVRYLRGACRDGGNWANSGSALDGGVSETGSDVGSDTAVTDSGSDDTAVTDSGSDTATATTDAADDGG